MKKLQSFSALLEERLLGDEESLEIEFKAARRGLPKDLWPTVSAFANTQGGWIVLGVSEQDGKALAAGVENPTALLKEFHDCVRNPQKISYPVCGAGDTSIEQIGERHVVVIRVPAAPRRVRPVYVNNNVYDGTYVRRHSGDYRCLKAEVDRMMREASDVSSDSTILPRLDWTDLDSDALARFRRRCLTRSPADPKSGYDDQRFLRAIGGYRRDRDSGEEGITVAGLLLFGTEEAIREWRPRHLIDFRLVGDDASLEDRWDDRVAWEGHLLGAFEVMYPKLVGGAASPFRLSRGGVRAEEGPEHVALREAFVNLLVHADYAELQASLVKVSPEGYLFRNPGSSRVSEFDLLSGDRSDPRNPSLVRMMRMAGLAEEAGTGMPKIVRAWRELGFALPNIDAGSERYEFSLQLRHAHLIADDDRAWLSQLGDQWSEAEQLALVMARHEGVVDNLSLRRRSGQHSADASKVLVQLRNRGLLERVERTGWPPRYRLGQTAIEAVPDSEGSGQGRDETLADLDIVLEDSAASLGGSAPSLEDLPASLGGLPGSPEGLRQTLWELARPARERPHMDAADRDRIVEELCSLAPLSIRQIADLLGRSPEHMRVVLRTLMTSGRLAQRIPDRPSHPGQQYVATQPRDH